MATTIRHSTSMKIFKHFWQPNARKCSSPKLLQTTNHQSSICLNHRTMRRFYTNATTKSQEHKIEDSDNLTSLHLFEDDMHNFFSEIKAILKSETICHTQQVMCNYNFDASGKCVRPKIAFLMSRTCNFHVNNQSVISCQQHKIAKIAEMIHVGSLLHDDVVDVSFMRRGKESVNAVWGNKKAVLAGNYIMGRASNLLSSTQNDTVVGIMSTILTDLVNGELMQEDSNDQFEQYLSRIYKKTASVIANSCKSVAVLSGASSDVVEDAFCYGRDIGIAFQLVDDILDFQQSGDILGKPSAADLKLGIATAPVLFACEKHPYLHDLILRKFRKKGDVQKAWESVADSNGIEETKLLAQHYAMKACSYLQSLAPSNERKELIHVAHNIVHRTK